MGTKATLSTLKSFLKKNSGKLFIKTTSRFDGMYDSVEYVQDPKYVPVMGTYNATERNYGLSGIWLTTSTRNYITVVETDQYVGYEVWNCCGSFEIVTPRN